MRLRFHTSRYIALVVLAAGCHRHVPEPGGSSTNTPSPTREGDPDKPMASSFAGFRIGEPVEEAKRKCRDSGYVVDGEEQVALGFRSMRCEGVPVAEPGIDGEYVELGVCNEAICDLSLFQNAAPAAAYRKALATLTSKYGRPNELVSTAPSDEESATRGCAGASSLASASWIWDKANEDRIDVRLSCLDGRPYVYVDLLDAAARAAYGRMATDE